MFPAIHAGALQAAASLREQFAAAADVGFRGIELLVSESGPLAFDTSPNSLRELASQAEAHRLQVTALSSGSFWNCNYGSPQRAARDMARDRSLRMLDCAASIGAATIVVIPAVVGRAAERSSQTPYADALHRTFDALSELRFEAEARGVVLTMENCWNRFLLSPVEVSDLLDRVNSAWVGWCLDTGNVLAFGYPEDWITTLGRRIRHVHAKDYDLNRPGRDGFCTLGEGSVNWPEVLHALRTHGYNGPFTYEGPGDAADAFARVGAVLAEARLPERHAS